jgi:hypothetical protein
LSLTCLTIEKQDVLTQIESLKADADKRSARRAAANARIRCFRERQAKGLGIAQSCWMKYRKPPMR